MRYEEVNYYSNNLNKNINIKIYGHFGESFIVFPCQGKMSDDWSNYGMIDNLTDYINNGKIKLFCIDSNDYETVNKKDDYQYSSYKLNKYYDFVIYELIPFISRYNNSYTLPYAVGCSMGATHAANVFFRFPDLFKGVIGLSGAYDITMFFNGWTNEYLYNNSPAKFLGNMDNSHPYIQKYNSKNILLCVGDGSFENEVKWTQDIMLQHFKRLGINAFVDYWGIDSSHDWYWWKLQLKYFLEKII